MFEMFMSNRKLKFRNEVLEAEAKHMATITVELSAKILKMEEQLQKGFDAELLEQVCKDQASTIESLHTELNAIKLSTAHLTANYEATKNIAKENRELKKQLKQATSRIEVEKRKRRSKKGFYYFKKESK